MFGMLEAADEDRIRAIVRKVLAENPAAAGSEASGLGTLYVWPCAGTRRLPFVVRGLEGAVCMTCVVMWCGLFLLAYGRACSPPIQGVWRHS